MTMRAINECSMKEFASRPGLGVFTRYVPGILRPAIVVQTPNTADGPNRSVIHRDRFTNAIYYVERKADPGAKMGIDCISEPNRKLSPQGRPAARDCKIPSDQEEELLPVCLAVW
jgi:hypothetical protein